MATLPSYFDEALTNIEPDTDKANAALAHAEVTKVLKADKRLQDLGISPVLIGSYARSVSIKRVKDVDVFGRLEKAGEDLAPGKIMDTFEEVLSDDENFGSARVERQHRSFKVDFPDYGLTVDAVPARPCGDHWELPNRPEDAARAQWVETNPLRLNELTTEANQTFTLNDNGIYVPVVKLVRQVRRNWLDKQPGGFFFEIMTYWAFTNGQPNGSSIAENLTIVLESIADMLPDVYADGLDDPTMDGKKISTKAVDADFEAAIEKIGEAAALARDAFEDDDDCSSAVKWRKLIGQSTEGDEIFPLPSYCNIDGTRKNASSITSGATTVPAGNGRYA
jgi:hypothetical protein